MSTSKCRVDLLTKMLLDKIRDTKRIIENGDFLVGITRGNGEVEGGQRRTNLGRG